MVYSSLSQKELKDDQKELRMAKRQLQSGGKVAAKRLKATHRGVTIAIDAEVRARL